jgi:hypothetical protein
MKKIQINTQVKLMVVLLVITCFNIISFAQVRLENVLVVAQQDKLEDRYSMELALTNLMQTNGVTSKSALGVIPQGEFMNVLATEEIQKKVKALGIDTYMLVSVRGYDRSFTPSKNLLGMRDELNAGHMFSFWRESANSISFTVTFYRNNQPIHYELIKIKNGKNREATIGKMVKAFEKRLQKNWLR